MRKQNAGKRQADMCREKQFRSYGGFAVGVAIIFTIWASVGRSSEASTQACPEPSNSHFVQVDAKSNLFRYEKGDGSKSVMTLSADLSITGNRFVLLVSTTPELEPQALAHAGKLKAWLTKNIEGVNEIPVVLYENDVGVGYTYYISGLRYLHEEFAQEGVMNPRQSVLALENVALSYKARKALRDGGAYSSLLD